MQDGSEDLADLGNVAARELELLQGVLEEGEAFGVVDANLELGRVAKVLPPLCAASGIVFQAEMGLFGAAGAGEKVVEDMEVALAGGDIRNATPLESVVQELTTEQDGVGGGGGIILEFVKQARPGGSRRGSGLGGGQGIKDVGGK